MGRDRYLDTIESLLKEDGKLLKKLTVEISSAKDLQSCYKTLLKVKNVGKFLSWQVLCDLLESHVIPFSEDSWVKLGPGAIGGLKSIFGESISGKDILQKSKTLRKMQRDVFYALGIEFPKFIGRDLTLKNIEHALCEFCKYKEDHVMRRYNVGGKGSRSHLDLMSCLSCNTVDQVPQAQLHLCCLCRGGFCISCHTENGKDFDGAWLCNVCIGIEGMK